MEKGEILFEKGVLCAVSISTWSAKRKLRKDVQVDDTDPNWVEAAKRLTNEESIELLWKIRNEVRNYLNSIALPFPVRGMVFIPKDLVKKVDEWLEKKKALFNSLVEEISKPENYQQIKEAGKKALGKNFREEDYPKDLRDAYNFQWQWIVLDVPERLKKFDYYLYEREREKYLKQLEKAKEGMILALRQEFYNLVHRLVERLSNPRNVFRDSLVNNFNNFFDLFESRNCFNDEKLKMLVSKARRLLNGVQADDFRNDEVLREKIAKDFQKIEKVIDKNLLTRTRKVLLPEEES